MVGLQILEFMITINHQHYPLLGTIGNKSVPFLTGVLQREAATLLEKHHEIFGMD